MGKKTKAEHLQALLDTAEAAVQYVGAANYDHRERAALNAIRLAHCTGEYVSPESCDR